MAEFLVEYDVVERYDEEYESADGEKYLEETEDIWSDELVVEADDEEDAREAAYDELYNDYEDVYVWSVKRTGVLSEED